MIYIEYEYRVTDSMSKFLQQLDWTADLCGTEILSPLNHVYKQSPVPGYLRQIFVLTDGEVMIIVHVVCIPYASTLK